MSIMRPNPLIPRLNDTGNYMMSEKEWKEQEQRDKESVADYKQQVLASSDPSVWEEAWKNTHQTDEYEFRKTLEKRLFGG